MTFKAVKCCRISEIGKLWEGYDVVAIDEGQFFPDVIFRSFSLLKCAKCLPTEIRSSLWLGWMALSRGSHLAVSSSLFQLPKKS